MAVEGNLSRSVPVLVGAMSWMVNFAGSGVSTTAGVGMAAAVERVLRAARKTKVVVDCIVMVIEEDEVMV